MGNNMTRRNFLKVAGTAAAAAAVLPEIAGYASAASTESVKKEPPVPGTGGDTYIPYNKRQGKESVVYFTRDLSPAGLIKLYDRIGTNLNGKIAIKLHTGEQHGPNIIPAPWVKELMEAKIKGGTIVETNTYYTGDRDTTEKHLETLKVNGWTFAPVDIMDAEGTTMLPVKNAKWFTEMSVGKDLVNYDSLLVLTHFKGHTMGGFGGSNKNIGIGCADGKIGKKMIHRGDLNGQWAITQEHFMENFTECSKAVVDHFQNNISFINVMRNMSVSCDCEGISAAPVVTPNVGILASTDILAIDQASVDLIYAMPEHFHHDFVERMTSRHGLRQLTYMKELGMGCDRYALIDCDNGDKIISVNEAVKHIEAFKG